MATPRAFQNVLIFSIVVLGIGGGLYGAFQGWYSSGFASVIATSGLVLATTLSLITTRNTLHEQRLAREQQAKPLLRLTLEEVSREAYSVMAENVGNGPATDVDITIKAISDNVEGEQVHDAINTSLPVISPSESIAVSVGLDNIENPASFQLTDKSHSEEQRFFKQVDQISEDELEDIDYLVMTGTCCDILDSEHEIQSIFYTKYAEEGRAQYGRHDTASQLRKIERGLNKVDRSLSKIERGISLLR